MGQQTSYVLAIPREERFEPMNRMRLKQFSALDYRDPRPFLASLRRFEHVVAASSTPERIKTLRTNGLKEERELRDAAIFAVGMSEVLGLTVFIAPIEAEDFDFVATWIDDERTQHFCRVQLKEVVAEHLNPATSLEAVIGGLSRYADASELTVAIKVNHPRRFDPAEVSVPQGLKLGALWVYSAISEDQGKFSVWGDFMQRETPIVGRVFDYPRDA